MPLSRRSAEHAAIRVDLLLTSGHTLGSMAVTRTIVIKGDVDPVPIVFEMVGPTIVIQPGEALRLVLTGPDDAELTVGYGRNGISLFRDEGLAVEAFGPDDEPIDTAGFA